MSSLISSRQHPESHRFGRFTLQPEERRLLADGQQVALGARALDHLRALVDKSPVLAEGDPMPCYRLLETTRAYALERLVEAGETERTLRRHAQAMLALLASYEKDDRRWRITPADSVALAAELDNLRAALGWAVVSTDGSDLVIALAGASIHVWLATNQSAEGIERLLALR